MKFLTKTLINTGVIAFLAYLLPGIHIENNFFYIILVAILLSILNAVLRPILVFLTLPATIVSFGFFILIINAGIVMLTDKMLTGFTVDSFWWAFLFSILMTVINSVIDKLIHEKKSKKVIIKNGNEKVIVIEKD